MSTAALAAVRLTLARESANPAPSSIVLDSFTDELVMVRELTAIMEPSVRTRGQIVVLRPRTFEETAKHFLKIARPVDWPVEDPDED